MSLLSAIYQDVMKRGKCHLPDFSAKGIFGLYLKITTWGDICRMQGWRKGQYSRYAEYLGCTRQYAAGLAQGKFSFENTDFYARTVLLCQGRLDGHYCHLFEFRFKVKNIDPNHPMFNYAKYNGMIPYGKHSLAVEFRRQQYDAEKK